ncbi:MAG: hypothetical protein J7J31_04370 [Helicobacteraceae bacterium]|nr:hypothetical protein [Helicobacteraceae bacterium]
MFRVKKNLLYINDNLVFTKEINSFLSKYFKKVYFTTDMPRIEEISSQKDLKIIVVDTRFVSYELSSLLEKVQMNNEKLMLLFQHEKKSLHELFQFMK